VCIPKNWYYL